MQITFLGAAGEVTGSSYLVETGTLRFLVDCGLFQGGREAYLKNLRALNWDPRSLDFVLLSHAHLDHSGLLPRLCALGFRGAIYATPATTDLLSVMLLDSAHIQEKEAEWENRQHHGRHARRGFEKAPLYTVAQALSSLKQLRSVDYGTQFQPHPDVACCFLEAGHILGSSIIEVQINGRKLVFSGDLGQPARPVMRDPQPVFDADYLLVESTYGNRLHRSMVETEEELVTVLNTTLDTGNVIIPAFSVGRTQELLFVLTDLVRRGRLAPTTIYVDSPMSAAVTELTLKYQSILDAEAQELIVWQRQHPGQPRIHFVHDVDESIALNHIQRGAVIISASGMCDAGRIKYHLRQNLPRPECAVVLAGFQAAGTLGRRLVDGARQATLFGQRLPVRAAIHTIGGLSAHADQDALLAWLQHFRRPPINTFIVHGEATASREFAAAVTQRLGWRQVTLPIAGQTFALQ